MTFYNSILPKYDSRETPLEHRLNLDHETPNYDIKKVSPREGKIFRLSRDDLIIAGYKEKDTLYMVTGAKLK